MISTADLYQNTKELEILFVEDDIQLLKEMSNIFSNLFKNVATAKNGQEGLNKFEAKLNEDEKAYDLVITDINMPVMNGIDMINEVYKLVPDQPTLIVSAHSDADYLIDLLNLGVNGFLIKPIKFDMIKRALYSVCKAIINEELVKRHYIEIEALNDELSIQSKELIKLNNDLRDKNIALEKSMRIIEGMHHKDQVNKDTTIDINHKEKNNSCKKQEVKPEADTISDTSKALNNIEYIICNLALKYNNDGTQNELLIKLSDEINNYVNSLEDKYIYSNLKESLKELAQTVLNHPECTTEKELNRVFTMIESFFYIYSKWQNEWSSIDDTQFELFSRTIENEIKTLIDVWLCKI